MMMITMIMIMIMIIVMNKSKYSNTIVFKQSNQRNEARNEASGRPHRFPAGRTVCPPGRPAGQRRYAKNSKTNENYF